MVVGGLTFNRRFESFFNVGLQAGLFAFGRLRVAGRILMFPADPGDDYENDSYGSDDDVAFPFQPLPSEPPAFLFGGSVGFAAARTANFALSPGFALLSSDQADEYGSFAGLAIPFDWVTDSGLRVGFEVTVGRSFGGRVLARCNNFNSGGPPLPNECANGEERYFNRAGGAGFYSHFQLGWGFDHPKPIGYKDSR